MALRPGIGRAAGLVGRGAGQSATAPGRALLGGRRGGMFALGGTAAVAGMATEVTDPEGPYGEFQEEIFGDRDAIRHSMRASLKTAFDNSDQHDIQGTNDFYYGRPVNVPGMERRRSSGSMTPVPGSVVFGMYNTRR